MNELTPNPEENNCAASCSWWLPAFSCLWVSQGVWQRCTVECICGLNEGALCNRHAELEVVVDVIQWGHCLERCKACSLPTLVDMNVGMGTVWWVVVFFSVGGAF